MFFKKKDPRENTKPSAPVDRQAIDQKIRAFVAGKTKLVKEADIKDDTKLFSSGLLDSLAFIQLVTFVDSQFHIRLSDTAEVNMDSFDLFGQIVDLTARGLAAK